ncbi:MAG TPA: GNAT family N-acetyltransferase [Bdellovibrionales bacterium]|nr:GNAT family N-acetyltransferase [Bdellovibrionales bacterium]
MKSADSKLTIRRASVTDVPVILELIKALAEFEKLAHEVVATEDMLQKTLFGEKPSAEVVIAELQGENQPVGFALFFTTYSTFLGRPGIYLEDLFVKPEFRSQKIGHKLLQFLAKTAVERGCGRLEWSVLDWNVRAREFYERLGAARMEEWTVHRLAGANLKNLADSN